MTTQQRCNRCDLPAAVRLQAVTARSGRLLANEMLCNEHLDLEEKLRLHDPVTVVHVREGLR